MREIDVSGSLPPHRFTKRREGEEGEKKVVFHSVVKLKGTDIILLMSALLK